MATGKATSSRSTRAARSKVEHALDDMITTKVEVEEQPKATSFNGKITQFAYKISPTSTSSETTRSSRAAARQASFQQPTLRQTSLKRPATGDDQARESPSPMKKIRHSSKYAPPSKYAHLNELTDIFAPNLIGIFVGTNPGVQTATAGHAYAHPSNHFWKLLHSSGLTDRRLKPEEDVTLPEKYQMGNTNIVSRPSKDAAELSKEELVAGAAVLEEKFAKWQPEAVCIVGKGIWESIWRWKYGRAFRKGEFSYGWQAKKENMGKTKDWAGARVFVTTSTSGLAANLKPAEKEAIWKPFGDWVQQRRKERADEAAGKGGKITAPGEEVKSQDD